MLLIKFCLLKYETLSKSSILPHLTVVYATVDRWPLIINICVFRVCAYCAMCIPSRNRQILKIALVLYKGLIGRVHAMYPTTLCQCHCWANMSAQNLCKRLLWYTICVFYCELVEFQANLCYFQCIRVTKMRIYLCSNFSICSWWCWSSCGGFILRGNVGRGCALVVWFVQRANYND